MSQTYFNPPPSWPIPPGWMPTPDWEPDPAWPPAPPGWEFFVAVPPAERPWSGAPLEAEFGPSQSAEHPAESPWRGAPVETEFGPPPAFPWGPPRRARISPRWLALAVVAAVGIIGGSAFLYHKANEPDIVVLKPVDALGNIQTGWTVTSRSGATIDCSYGSPSRYDKSAGVRWCGANADSADACWATPDDSHVLCLRDPFSKGLALIPARGLSVPRKPLKDDPVPFGLLLDDGTQCRVRLGGAWGSPTEHPDWIGFYSCRLISTISTGTTDAEGAAVWGPRGGGVDKGFGGWTVMVGSEKGHLSKHNVTKAFYVAVA